MSQITHANYDLVPATIGGFESVYKKYYPLLYSLSYRILKQHEECEEVIHDIFLKLWEDREQLKLQSGLKAYLCKAVINSSLNRVNRASNLRTHHKQIFLESDLADYTDVLERAEKIDLVRREIQNLPEQCRKVFEMSRYEEKPHKQIADELNISVKTVKAHIGHALSSLRNSALAQKLLTWFSLIYTCAEIFFKTD